MSASRDNVARELALFLHSEGLDAPWSERRGTSTRWAYSADGVLYDLTRLRLHQNLITIQCELQSGVTAKGTLAVVVTAGPPGAGKSTALAAFSELGTFRHVDADDFKDPLLTRARDDGLLASWMSHVLSDGRPIAPRELASFVHAESTAIADAMRQQCLANRENIVIHGTLSSQKYTDVLLGELDKYGYEKLIIVDVEVSAEQAIEQALSRWWDRRESADPLGGLFIPPREIRRYYVAGAAESVCAANAAALGTRASELGWDIEFKPVKPGLSL